MDLKDKKLVLFGAGAAGRKLLNKLHYYGIVPAYFIDNNPGKKFIECAEMQSLKAIPVYLPERLFSENKENLRIIITSWAPLRQEMETQLKEMGLSDFCLDKGEIISYLSKAEDEKFGNDFEHFRQSYLPVKLPELRLFRPRYPFGEMAVLLDGVGGGTEPVNLFSGFCKT